MGVQEDESFWGCSELGAFCAVGDYYLADLFCNEVDRLDQGKITFNKRMEQ